MGYSHNVVVVASSAILEDHATKPIVRTATITLRRELVALGGRATTPKRDACRRKSRASAMPETIVTEIANARQPGSCMTRKNFTTRNVGKRVAVYKQAVAIPRALCARSSHSRSGGITR